MSQISRFFTTTFTLERMNWTNESSAMVSGDSFDGHIQQATTEAIEYIGESWGNTYTIWCDVDTDVEIGDRLTVASGSYAGVYNVRDVQTNATGGRNEHLELVVVKGAQ